LHLKINQFPFNFILDTGVETAILTDKTLGKLANVHFDRELILPGVGEVDELKAFYANSVSIALDGIICKKCPLIVLEKDYLELSKYLGINVHGIIGHELFKCFTVEIDYLRNEITLWKPEKHRFRKSYTSIPLELSESKPYMKAHFIMYTSRSIEIDFLIDVGASHAVLIENNDSTGIQKPVSAISMIIGRGLGGAINGSLGRIEGFGFGNYKLTGVITAFADNYYPDGHISPRTIRGTIGGEVLKRFHVAIDYKGQRMYLKKNGSFKKEFEYNMSGLEIIASNYKEHIYDIDHVFPGSPANEAGLLVGDRIISLNGISAKYLTLNRINALLASKPGKRIRIKVSRNNEFIVFSFRLKRLL